jgi:hypothetical protein
MGTIFGRTRKDGTTSYLAQILLKRKGQIVHRESQTFDRKQAAKAWLARRKTELIQPGAFDRREDPKLMEVIDRYIADAKRPLGSTKKQVLNSIKQHEIAERKCSDIKSPDLVAFAQSLKVQPQTRQCYMSHLSGIFAIARPMWGIPLEQREMQDAMVVCRKMGIAATSSVTSRWRSCYARRCAVIFRCRLCALRQARRPSAACILPIWRPISTNDGRLRSRNATSFAVRPDYDRGTPWASIGATTTGKPRLANCGRLNSM